MNKPNFHVIAVSILLACLAGGGCATPKKLEAVMFTEQALAATDPARVGTLEKGSPAEERAIEQFKRFNSDFSKSNIVQNTKLVYDTGIYFRDPFKEIYGEPEFERYLVRGSEATREFSMEWLDVSEHGGDYYFRWIMSTKLKRLDKKHTNRTTGISHVRFGKDGKVIFHQDYFDGAAFLYEKIPVLGAEIRYFKRRL